MIAKAATKMQAKRNPSAEKISHRHPLLFTVGVIAFLMFAGGGYLGQKLFDPSAFPITKIAVEGEFHQITSEHVEALVSNAVHGGFFSVDVANVRNRILDDPWIFDAAVQRVWPDTVRVSIREQSAIARWGEYALLNQFADIFVPDTSELPSNLPTLNGPIGTEAELLSRYETARRRLSNLGLMIARVEMSDRGAWVVELTGGTTLVVGREELDQRLSRFTRAFDHFLKESWEKVDSIDLRYTNGFAVREKAVGVDNG